MPEDLYHLFRSEPSLAFKLKSFAKKRGIELTIAIVGLFIGLATVLVSYKVGIHQEILQSSRMTDSYFNGIVELFAKSLEDNQRINLLMIARTEAILEDLQQLRKPDKAASVITFVSNLKPSLFFAERGEDVNREKHIILSKINLTATYLANIDLHQANLSASLLKGSDLTATNLSGANLHKANLSGAQLDFTNFDGADLSEANLNQASIFKTSFENANLENAIWINGLRCKKGSIGHCIF